MNGIRTAILMTVMIVLFALAGQALAGSNGMILAFLLAVGMNFAGWWFGDRIVLKMYRATEVSRQDAPELYDLIDRLRVEAGLPMPRVYVIPGDQPNAFATGRNPNHSAVAVTQGIVRLLDRHELEGVIAHELAHIQNRDTLISSMAATLAAAITLIARFGFFFGGGDNRGNAVSTLLMFILAPLAAAAIQMAISRAREYVADRDGARICGSPGSLADALGKLQHGAKRLPMNANPATAHLFIMNPFAGRAKGILHLFSTHPPTEERIRRLRAMGP